MHERLRGRNLRTTFTMYDAFVVRHSIRSRNVRSVRSDRFSIVEIVGHNIFDHFVARFGMHVFHTGVALLAIEKRS